MKANMGKMDKIIRIVIAAVLTVLFFTNIIVGTLGIILICIAGILLLTSIINFCPLYAPFGICSIPKSKN